MVRDQSQEYGAQYSGVYDLLFQRDHVAEQAADMLHALAGGGRPSAVELGVGTGRVALPLARRGARVTGIDTSPELLRIAHDAAELDGTALSLVQADMRTWSAEQPADVTYCVCATLSMVDTEQEQLAVLQRALASTVPGGHVVIETHNPDYVWAMHSERSSIDLPIPVTGLAGSMVMHSHVPDPQGLWHVVSTWRDPTGEMRAEEFSRLTHPDALEALARSVGLVPRGRAADFTGAPLTPHSPLYVSTFVRPALP